MPENFQFKAIYPRVGVFFITARFLGWRKTPVLYQGTTFSRAAQASKMMGFSPCHSRGYEKLAFFPPPLDAIIHMPFDGYTRRWRILWKPNSISPCRRSFLRK